VPVVVWHALLLLLLLLESSFVERWLLTWPLVEPQEWLALAARQSVHVGHHWWEQLLDVRNHHYHHHLEEYLWGNE
jgi:hypothetical protein